MAIRQRQRLGGSTMQERANSTPAGVAAASQQPRQMAPNQPPVGSPQSMNWNQPRMPSNNVLPPSGADSLHSQKLANIQQTADAASAVYNQMGQANPGSTYSQRQAGGYSTDQYGRQFQMTPQMQGLAVPAPGQSGWMQGSSLSGAPAGRFIQTPGIPTGASMLPSQMAPQQREAYLTSRGLTEGVSPGFNSIAIRNPRGGLTLYGNRTASSLDSGSTPQQVYNDARTRNAEATVASPGYQNFKSFQRQQADEKIIARARIRGLTASNSPTVRAAMERRGLLNKPAIAGQQQGQNIAAGSGAAIPASQTEAVRGAQRMAQQPFLQNSFAGGDPLAAGPQDFAPLLDQTTNPADAKVLSQFLAYKLTADPQFRNLPLTQRQLLDSYAVGGPTAYARMKGTMASQQSAQQAQFQGSPSGEAISPSDVGRGGYQGGASPRYTGQGGPLAPFGLSGWGQQAEPSAPVPRDARQPTIIRRRMLNGTPSF